MFGSILPLLRMAGMGRRRRRIGGRKRVGRRRTGGRKMMIQGSGRRRRVRRTGRAMRGRGIFDTIKNIGRKAFDVVRSVPIISTGLNLAGQKKYADAAKSIGLGRRKRRYGGRMSVYGGRRRRYRKRRGGKRRATKRRFSLFGGRKRRMRGRGVLSRLITNLLGGRRRTYRTGLLSRRR
jgi:hypothetical protein